MTTTPNPIVSTQKLFKFYDLSTAQVIQTTATTEREARKSLGKQSLIFIARIRLTPIIERARTWGGYSHE
ncbi:host cell division inhibitor Icd-like protein [Gilliamella apicola]|nr:host cell division inhibitor Icd-like protein [Gilliamella apicola]